MVVREMRPHVAPAANMVEQQGDGDNDGYRDQGADHQVQISHRGHAGGRGKENHEAGDDVHAGGLFNLGEDEVKNVAAADELVAGDDDAGDYDGDAAKDSGGGIVPGLQQIGNGELGEAAGAAGNEGNQNEAQPTAGGLPERGETIAVGVFGAAKQAARADPGREQREDQHGPRESAAGQHEVGFVANQPGLVDGDGQERRDDDGKDNGVNHGGEVVQVTRVGRLARPAVSRRSVTLKEIASSSQS